MRDLKRKRDNAQMKAERLRQWRHDPSATLKTVEKLDKQLAELKSGQGSKANLEALANNLKSKNIRDIAGLQKLHIDLAKETNRLPDTASEKTRFQASPVGKKIANDHSKIGSSLLERQVPTWYSRHGVNFEQTRTNIIAETNPPKPNVVTLPKLPKNIDNHITQFFERKFVNSDEAKQHFLEMAAEAKKTAYWYVNNRPETFGRTTPNTDIKLYERRGQKSFHLSKDWQKQASTKISEVEAQTSGSQRQIRHRAATRIRQLHKDRLKLEADLLPANEFLRPKVDRTVRKVGVWDKARSFFKKDTTSKPTKQQTRQKRSGLSARSKLPMTEKQVKANMEAIRKASIGPERAINPFNLIKGR